MGLVVAVQVMVIVAALVGLITIPVGWGLYDATEDHVDEFGQVRRDDLDDVLVPFAAVNLLWVVVFLAAAAVFIIWMYRVARNNELLGRPGRPLGPGWAIGGWLIPLANYVIPIIHLNHLWKGADGAVPRGDPGWRNVPTSPVLWIWWVAFASPNIMRIVANFMRLPEDDRNRQETLETMSMQMTLNTISQIMLVIAAVLCCVVVGRLTQRQEEASWALMGAAPGSRPGGGPPFPGAGSAPYAPSVPPGGWPPAWMPDPLGRFDLRYWDGGQWTSHVARGGRQHIDPV